MATTKTGAILFGGWDTSEDLADTWLFTGTQWQSLPTTDSGPLARSQHALATLGDQVVLFGGVFNGAAAIGDTWTFTDNNWTWNSATGPVKRRAHAMTGLPSQVVLFGGLDDAGDPLGDTWTFNGGSWTEIDTLVDGATWVSPTPRSGHAMATLNGKAVLFGGDYHGISQGDTWTFDGSSWTSIGGEAPAARSGHVMATLGGEVVLYGGTSSATGPLNDVWTFDDQGWHKFPGETPAAGIDYAMATLPP
jgi:hypothetical protein